MHTTVDEVPETPVPQPGTGQNKKRYASSFIEHLVRNQIISDSVAVEVSEWLQFQSGKEKRRLVDVLADDHRIPRHIIAREVAQFYAFRILDISDRNIRRLPPVKIKKLLDDLPGPAYRTAMRMKLLPFETAEGQLDKLLIVTPNPSEREVFDVARLFPYAKFEICYMKEDDWNDLWQHVQNAKQPTLTKDGVEEVFVEEADDELDDQLEREIDRGHLVALVGDIFSDAVRTGASDIHVIPRGARRTEVGFRIDGQLTPWFTIEDARAEAVVAVVKGHALGLDRFERMSAQDGSAQKNIDGVVYRFRISVLPIISRETRGKFESVVIRVLRDADASITLENIGLDPYSLEAFREAIEKPHGMVILTGPTGSGKSTTLVAALRTVMKPSLCTITVEDPVEYLLDGARQVKLNAKLDFSDAMRAILRHDPDIVMVGEIRDKITADIAIKLANTGHLTFSTLHTNDAAGVVSRLFKIGVEPFLIAQALNIVVAQRLVRKLCERCKQPMNTPNEAFLRRTGFTDDEISSVELFQPVGCIHCVSGFKGRTAIHETLMIDHEVRDLILNSGDRIDVMALHDTAIRHGMRTLRRSGIELAKKGITSVDEVISNTTYD